MKEFAPFRLDAADQSLWRGDQRIHLPPKAFDILHYLVQRAGRLVTQNELLEVHWPDTFVQPEVLKSQILNIRTALGDRVKDPLFIETVPRRGYRFIAPVHDSAAAERVTPPPAAPPAPGPTNLVGRAAALDELRSCLRKASSGERQIVFVTGEQGMGKTTLVEAFLQEAGASGVSFARGQCLEGFGMVKEPYYPVLEAMGQLARGNGATALAAVLEAHAPTWLIQLPALLKPEHRQTLQRELLGATRERMIREMCEALESLTEQSVLILLLEDLHWADHSTVDLIAAIAHRRSPARLLLIGAYRPVDLVLSGHPLKQVSHALKGRRLAREIAISPFGAAEIAEYLAREAGGDAEPDPAAGRLAQWIEKQTEGNPLFIVTVVDHLLESGYVRLNGSAWQVVRPLDQVGSAVPDTLRQMIEVYIDRLSAREQLILEAAGVYGPVFLASLTAQALEFEAGDVEQACQNLAQYSHIVRMSSAERLPGGAFAQGYEFIHAAFRNVFYHRLAPARRAKLHRRFGEIVEAAHAGDRSPVAPELAGHFEQCADWPRVVEYLLLAAKNAWRRFDYLEAASVLDRAIQAAANLDESQRLLAEVRALDSLTILQQAFHDIRELVPSLEKLADRAARCGAADIEARALIALSSVRAAEDARDCLPLAERLERVLANEKDPVARASVQAPWILVRTSAFGWDAAKAEEVAGLLEIVRAGGSRLALFSLLMDSSYALWASTRYRESCARAEESLPAMLEAGRLVRYLHGRDLIASNLAMLGEWGKALDILDEAIANARKNEAIRRMLMPMVFKAWVHLTAMDYRGALEICAETLPLLDAPFMRDRRYIAQRIAASAELGLGNVDVALERLTALRDRVEAHRVTLSWYWLMPLQIDVAAASLARGDIGRARIEADHALDVTLRNADRTWQALAWEMSAQVWLREGDVARAENDVQNAIEAIRGFEAPLAAWRVHATAARIHRLRGNDEQERRALEISRGVLRTLAGSLESRPGLRQAFLSSSDVSAVLGSEASATAAGPSGD